MSDAVVSQVVVEALEEIISDAVVSQVVVEALVSETENEPAPAVPSLWERACQQGAAYELYLSDPLGNRLEVISAYHSLSWTRAVNSMGQCMLTFGAEQFDRRLFRVDRRLEVWRVLSTGVSKLVNIYYLRYLRRGTTTSGEQSIIIGGPDRVGLLDTRIVAYAAGSAQSTKTDYADDMLKEIVTENLGASAGAGRDLTAYGFTVQADQSAAPSLSKSFSRRRVLDVLQDVAAASAALGTRLYFDVISPTLPTLEFRTYINQRGTDRRARMTPFSLERGQLGWAQNTLDRRDEHNVIYAAGQGLEADREVVVLSDAVSVAASPWNRREALADGRQNASTAALTAWGYAKLREGLQVRAFEALIQDAPASRFQLDWDLGDLLTAEYDEEIYDCEVSAISGNVTPTTDRIEAKLEYVE